MWFVRGLLCFALYSVFQHHGVVSGLAAPVDHLQAAISDTVNGLWAELIEGSISLTRSMVSGPNVVESSRAPRMLTDDTFEKGLFILSSIVPDTNSEVNTGRGFDYALNIFRVALDYIMNTWREVKSSMVDRVLDWQSIATEFLLSPVEYFLNFVFRPIAGRSPVINAIYEHFENLRIFRSRNLFATMINIFADVAKTFVANLVTGGRSASTARSAAEFGFQRIKRMLMESSAENVGYLSVYDQKRIVLLNELNKNDLSFPVQAMNMYAYSIWSYLEFNSLYSAIVDQCYNKDRLEYTLIEGESYTDDRYLHAVIDNANAHREGACKFYKSEMGTNASNAGSFITEQFKRILRTTYDHTTPIPSDVVMVDAVAQNVLGSAEPACLLSFLCKAGSFRVQHAFHPGVDLLLGIVVSGSKGIDQPIISKLGTPRMAEAIYRGYNDDCAEYTTEGKNCVNLQPFLKSIKVGMKIQYA